MNKLPLSPLRSGGNQLAIACSIRLHNLHVSHIIDIRFNSAVFNKLATRCILSAASSPSPENWANSFIRRTCSGSWTLARPIPGAVKSDGERPYSFGNDHLRIKYKIYILNVNIVEYRCWWLDNDTGCARRVKGRSHTVRCRALPLLSNSAILLEVFTPPVRYRASNAAEVDRHNLKNCRTNRMVTYCNARQRCFVWLPRGVWKLLNGA